MREIDRDFYNLLRLPVTLIMNANMPKVLPDRKVFQVREILKINQLDGVAITDEDGRLVGIVTMYDLLKAIEENKRDASVEDIMTRDVITLSPNHTLADAIEYFRVYGYGRFPVVDGDRMFLGMVTPLDIVIRLPVLKEEKEEIKEGKGEEAKVIRLEFSVEGGDFINGGEASSKIKRYLQNLGLSRDIIKRVAVASYEMEMNIVIHAYRGKLIVEISSDKIMIKAIDEGPGIEDIEKAIQPGYSTASPKVRELGFGAGMGLPNIISCSDEFDIKSTVGVGTEVTSVIYIK
ncbi:MAG: CBS domain-containing protein [bacterium]|nr:CBS domain-containing protein [bacterium]